MYEKFNLVYLTLFICLSDYIAVYSEICVLYTLPMNINGYVPFLILLYTLPMNIDGYVPFLRLLYTLPMNINGYVPFLILLYTWPMSINGYVGHYFEWVKIY